MSHYYPAKCERCGRYHHTVERRRMNTQYVDDESNYCFQCEPCFEQTQEEWQDMWDEYYGGRL